MENLTNNEMDATKKRAEAVMEFLIAVEVGRRSRMPTPAMPQGEVKLSEFTVPPDPKPDPIEKSKVPSVDPEQLIGVEKVVELLECSPRTVRRLADSGRMPRPRKLGALIRWPVAEIRKWIDEGCPKQHRRRWHLLRAEGGRRYWE